MESYRGDSEALLGVIPASLWDPVTAISAMRNVFLFHYVGDILLTSEPHTQGSSDCSVMPGEYR